MADRETDDVNGESDQQLRYYQMRGETWLLKLKLIILAVLCVLLGAFLVAFKVQAHIQDLRTMHDHHLSDEHNRSLYRNLSEKDELIKQLQLHNLNLQMYAKEKENIIHLLQEEIDQLKRAKEKDVPIKLLPIEMKKLDSAPCVGDACCAEGWKYFSGRCYYFSTDKKTWTESRDACVAAGGHLVIISSTEEQDFLKSSYGGSGEQQYWVGLTDAVKEGDWRWLDGTRLSETPKYWNRGEPDNWKGERNQYPEGEDCAEMLLHTTNYYLQDGFCDVDRKTEKRVCEAKALI